MVDAGVDEAAGVYDGGRPSMGSILTGTEGDWLACNLGWAREPSEPSLEPVGPSHEPASQIIFGNQPSQARLEF
jgi:hypothetical protein